MGRLISSGQPSVVEGAAAESGVGSIVGGGGSCGGTRSNNEGCLAQTDEKVMEALHQFTLKRFENSDEVLEIQLSFLNVLFFGPVMPLGVIFTLIAKIVELRSDLVKLLFT